MNPGTKPTLKNEYASTGDTTPHLHLEWESFTPEQQHVPTLALFARNH